MRGRGHPEERRSGPPGSGGSDVRGDGAPRARLPRPLRRRRDLARRPAARRDRRRGGRPADRERGRHGGGRLQRRDLQLRRAPGGAVPAGPSLLHPLGHRGDRPPLRGARGAVRRAAARHVRLRRLGHERAAPGARPRPRRQEAALLRARRAGNRLRVGVARTDGLGGGPPRSRLRRDRHLPALPGGARAALRLLRGPQASTGAHPELGRGRHLAPALLAALLRGSLRRRTGGGGLRGDPGGGAGGGASGHGDQPEQSGGAVLCAGAVWGGGAAVCAGAEIPE